MANEAQSVQLTDVAGSLRRHWVIVTVMALLGCGLGVAASFAIPAKYEASTTVSVNPMTAGARTSSVDAAKTVSMPTEAGLARSRKVATEAAKALAPTYQLSPSQIISATTVGSPDNSLILNIRFSGSTAKQAAAGADAVAEAYLMTRRTDAANEVKRLVEAANQQIRNVQINAKRPSNNNEIGQRALQVQADSLAQKIADLGNIDLNPGQVVGSAAVPASPSTPGPVPLGLAGLVLGLFAGIPIALLRKEEDSEIGGVEGLHAIGDQIVLDGTKDTNRADTWDIAAFMLKIPAQIGPEGPFTIMVDAEKAGRTTTPGQELVDALQRRGRTARFVDAGAINEGKISRGWPTEKKRISWGGEIVVIDTTHLNSDANKVALATRSDSLLLARSTTDEAAALRRFTGLLKSKGVDIALTALFPSATESVTPHR